jgi:hypothetical protein
VWNRAWLLLVGATAAAIVTGIAFAATRTTRDSGHPGCWVGPRNGRNGDDGRIWLTPKGCVWLKRNFQLPYVEVPTLMLRWNKHVYRFPLPARMLTPEAQGLAPRPDDRIFTISWPFVFYSAREYRGPTAAGGPQHVWFGSISGEGTIPGDCTDYPEVTYGPCVHWLVLT